MVRRPVLALLLLAFPGRLSFSQPAGSEFRVNTFTSLAQYESGIAFDGNGNFVIVWASGSGLSGPGQDGSRLGIYGQRYGVNGTPVGPEFRINTFTTGNQAVPAVASDANGNFVVVWTSLQDSPASPSFGVYAQRYASDGSPRGGEFQVNTFTTGEQSGPAVASDASGNFVVVWNGYGQDGNGFGIFGQRYASSGAPLGGEFPINTETLGNEQRPAVASDSQGNFVVVWTIQAFIDQGAGQRYSNTGAPLGGEFTLGGSYPDVAVDSAGRFVVVWQAGLPAKDIFVQRYDAGGSPLGPSFQVNTYTNYDQKYASVATDGLGNFLVVWQTVEVGSEDIYAQRYDPSGAAVGGEFRVNTYTTSDQTFPRVRSSPKGTVVVTWDSNAQDGTLYSVYGQRFSFVPGDVDGSGGVDVADVFYLINALFAGGPSPAGSGDANGDGKVDVADVFYLVNYLFAGGPAPV